MKLLPSKFACRLLLLLSIIQSQQLLVWTLWIVAFMPLFQWSVFIAILFSIISNFIAHDFYFHYIHALYFIYFFNAQQQCAALCFTIGADDWRTMLVHWFKFQCVFPLWRAASHSSSCWLDDSGNRAIKQHVTQPSTF